MILQGVAKRIVGDAAVFYVKDTGKTHEDLFMALLAKKAGTLASIEYSDWLVNYMVDTVLSRHNITLDALIANKDVLRNALTSDSADEGEFYTPEVWCVEGRKYLERIMQSDWGKAHVWDAAAGGGNLMKSADYPADKLFLSSLLAEDIRVLNALYPGSIAFQCDFVSGIDYDPINIMFSRELPPQLLNALRSDEPIAFYMNPPYKVGAATRSDLGSLMTSQGMGRCGLDIFHQFVYRLISLKRVHAIKNMTLGLFGPVTLFHSRMLQPLLDELYSEFQFRTGFCFKASDFACTSETIEWAVGFTVWSTWKDGEDVSKRNPVVLDSKSLSPEGDVIELGSRLFADVGVNIEEWTQPKDVQRYVYLPSIKSYMTPTGQMEKIAENALGCLMSGTYAIRATRRACITSFPNPRGCAITEESFWRCVASFAVRRSYASNINPFTNCQYYSQPQTNVEGYDQWLIDSLPLFFFDVSALQSSYRGFMACGESWDMNNKLFPLDKDLLRQEISDEAILADMDAHPVDNSFVLRVLSETIPKMGVEARALCEYGLCCLVESLRGTLRRDAGYINHTIAWDAGLAQLRTSEALWNKAKETELLDLTSRLRTRLFAEVYKFGFLMDIDKGDSPDIMDDIIE